MTTDKKHKQIQEPRSVVITKYIIVAVAIVVGGLFLMTLTGCNEVQKIPQTSIKPLNQQLIPTDPNWIRAYGDTLETQIVFNLAVMRNDINVSRKNELVIANVMNKMHSIDPNDPNNLKLRIEKLEAKVYNNKEK